MINAVDNKCHATILVLGILVIILITVLTYDWRPKTWRIDIINSNVESITRNAYAYTSKTKCLKAAQEYEVAFCHKAN